MRETLTLQDVRDALAGRGCLVRYGSKHFCPTCQCDGHHHSPALNLRTGVQSPFVLRCHGPGACSFKDVLSAHHRNVSSGVSRNAAA